MADDGVLGAELAEELRGRRIDFHEVPLVDIAGLLDGSDPQGVAAKVAEACERVGFLYVTGHGVSDKLIEAAFAQTKALFDLPLEAKDRWHIRHSSAHRGYVPLFEENTDPEDTADKKEAFDLGVDLAADDPDVVAGKPLHGPNTWPEAALLPAFRPTIEAYDAEMRRLAGDLLRAFALGLELPEQWFADKVDRPLAQLRLLHYPPQAGRIERRELGCGAHTDYGCLTILAQDAVGGLQLLNSAGEWVDAPPVPGAFVVNIGDQMARWTNDRFKATLHRVINVSGRERYSMPYFFDPNYDTWVETLPSCLAPGETPRHAPVLAGEWLAQRLTATFTYRQQPGA
ncbi:Isopenicillin N synthase [Tistlia consotensis]|uniref:2-oxoglutarate-dependent ethylene/succinate-forming enzyme n=1 Tax=Tistlia consotensis USBA 355 TaxID=560819 RepID=A0A1Y6BSB3_9PROT|nr:2-oxoglutarate and iron-dependent oxygenase domain-containing protein [Tistlia consotensis]SMF17346.1 Isopenicillin N synthase [Tistlia consotensis USBA 355]SNR40514.1 Isopenicillin N synthase [Tistlia consotensis]